MTSTALRVGELARKTGLSVRTLHYYDEIALLSPSRRSESGYRLYSAGDVARLQQIVSLRQMGFSLVEIRACLDDPGQSVQRVIELHVGQLKEQLAVQHVLCTRLEAIAAHLNAAEEVSVDDFLQSMEMMNKMDTYYTPEQLAELEQRRQLLGDDHIRQVEAEWPVLIADVRAAMDQGTPPTDERVQALAIRWMALVEEFTGGNPGITKSLGNMWQQETSIHGMETAPMREMMSYVSQALAAARKTE